MLFGCPFFLSFSNVGYRWVYFGTGQLHGEDRKQATAKLALKQLSLLYPRPVCSFYSYSLDFFGGVYEEAWNDRTLKRAGQSR